MSKFSVSVLGTGFVGLVSAVCMADRGIKVIASTHNEKNANNINQAISPFYEVGLDELLKRVVERKDGNFECVVGRERAVLETDISMIIVGTPMREDKSIDLSFMESTATEIGEALKKKDGYHLVVVRSTVVPGTTRNMVGSLITEASGKQPGKDFGLCMQPEFLAEGRSIEDTLYPDRIIIGEYDEKSGQMLQELYEFFYGDHLKNCPILRMRIESAELVKYGNNCLLATKISYANEFANLAELVPGVDVVEVMKGVGLDYRIMGKFLNAGIGFGGSCFPKDVNAIRTFAKSKGYTPRLLEAVLDINEDQAFHAVDLAEEAAGDLSGKKITILGLAFKPGTDDMRYAPSRRVVQKLREKNVTNIIGYDPEAKETAVEVFRDQIQYADSIEEALKDAEVAILCTEWDEFYKLKPETFKKLMKDPVVIDGRRVFPFEEFNNELTFRAIGRVARK